MKRTFGVLVLALLFVAACGDDYTEEPGNNGANNGNNGANNGNNGANNGNNGANNGNNGANNGNNGANNGNNGNNGGNNGPDCPDVLEPVCGVDGVTYDNGCLAEAAGVEIAHAGACVVGDECLGNADCGRDMFCRFPEADACGLLLEFPGTCEPRPEACDDVYEPVCGCNDETYGNACAAAGAGVNVGYVGECEGPDPGQLCGSRGLEPCPRGQFCHFSLDAICGAADAPGVCEDIPEVCTEQYAPVCGCDGVTYDNDCFAAGAGVSAQHRGACEPDPDERCGGRGGVMCGRGEYCHYTLDDICGRADAQGVCLPRPDVCTEEFAPVCGCDGRTYPNACDAAAAGQSVLHEGACEEPNPGDECGGIRGLLCPRRDQFCAFTPDQMCGAGDQLGVCATRPEACTQQYDPVCGCDGHTYGNACTAASNGVSVQHAGVCEDPEPRPECGGFLGRVCERRGDYCFYEIDLMCGAGDQTGVCTARPEVCTDHLEPVCGCDNNDYTNPCEAASAGVSVLHTGHCR